MDQDIQEVVKSCCLPRSKTGTHSSAFTVLSLSISHRNCPQATFHSAQIFTTKLPCSHYKIKEIQGNFSSAIHMTG